MFDHRRIQRSKSAEENLVLTVRHGGGVVMIWAGVTPQTPRFTRLVWRKCEAEAESCSRTMIPSRQSSRMQWMDAAQASALPGWASTQRWNGCCYMQFCRPLHYGMFLAFSHAIPAFRLSLCWINKKYGGIRHALLSSQVVFLAHYNTWRNQKWNFNRCLSRYVCKHCSANGKAVHYACVCIWINITPAAWAHYISPKSDL